MQKISPLFQAWAVYYALTGIYWQLFIVLTSIDTYITAK